jgi:hypothetical protein
MYNSPMLVHDKKKKKFGSKDNELRRWHARENDELSMYEQRCTAADALSEPQKTVALQEARDIWNKFWTERPGCSKDPQCSARTPCGIPRCKFASPDSLTTGLSFPQAAAGGASMPGPPSPDLTAASAGTLAALPDPEPALSDLAQTPNATATDSPSTVDPLGTAMIQGASTAPQAAPQAPADRLTVWQTTTGLMRIFAKSDNKTLLIAALLFVLMLHFGGIPFF